MAYENFCEISQPPRLNTGLIPFTRSNVKIYSRYS
jgi:hypothetical protein